jgi:predicted nucleic acid-binding protein
LEEAHSVSFWDVLIIVAAQACGAAYLASEDLQAGRRFDGVETANPFA